MTNTNKAHQDAVERVRIKLQESKAFIGKVIVDEQKGVDLRAKDRNGKPYYFTVIKGTKQESKSVYSAVNSETWKFANNKHSKDLFFISEIEKNGIFSYYIYTPTEMWHRSNTPYVHLKCNPLKNISSLTEFKDTIELNPTAERYIGEDKMLEELKKLPSLLDKLKQIKG